MDRAEKVAIEMATSQLTALIKRSRRLGDEAQRCESLREEITDDDELGRAARLALTVAAHALNWAAIERDTQRLSDDLREAFRNAGLDV